MIEKSYVRLLIIGMLSVLLSGCHWFCRPPPDPTLTIVKTPDTVPNFLTCHRDIEKVFKKNQVYAYQKGDDILIIVPTKKYFYPSSAHFCTKKCPVLDAIVCLLNHYQMVDVKVAGYTDCLGSPIRNMALSRERAQAFTDYMWQDGLNARIVYATGYGDFNPIADNSTSAGRDLNNRIEITLRLPPANRVW